MKLGVNLRIDVSKLDKSRFYKGTKGVYVDLTTFIDTENVGQYGDNGIISQSVTKEERQGGVKLPILGNAKVFYTDGGNSGGQSRHEPQNNQQEPPDDDIPF